MDSQSTHQFPTILIAEDEALVLKMLAYRLQKEGYTVLTASDGKQALECLQNNIPDLVITDLMMPYHTGLEILEFVKNSLSPTIPVIVLSASGQESTVETAFSLGADDYALKPFSPNELVARVHKHLRSS